MAEGGCAKFNNAVQRVFGKEVSPVIYVWVTNDPLNPWSAEARLVKGADILGRFPKASAAKRKIAKELAADEGYQWLLIQYPHIDLVNV